MASNCGDSSFQSIIQGFMDPPVNITDFLADENPSPFVSITEQPRSRGLRFRYECEGPRAGSLLGTNSTSETRTCPRIQIMNYKGPAVVVVSCVTKDNPSRPHPHSLVGRDCKNGVCTITVDENNSENMQVKFSQLGIQCVKKKDIDEALRVRESIRVDPFNTGYQHQSGSLDLTVVCLCFQVFLWDNEKQMFQIALTPVVSEPIYDKKALSELVICRVSKHSALCCGGQEMFILCEKINKEDIEIRFFEEVDNGQLNWEGFGEFSPSEVHKQVAIVFKIPPYGDQHITRPVSVMFQLKRPSDRETSDPKPFQYLPLDPDPEGIKRKRQKVLSMTQYMEDLGFRSSPLPSTSSTLPTINVFQNRTIRQPERKTVKQESVPLNNCIFIPTTSSPFSSFASSSTKKEEMATNNSTFTGATATTNMSSGDYFFQSTFLQSPFNFMSETLPQQEVGMNEINNPEPNRFDQSYNQRNTDLEQNANEFQNVLDNMMAQHCENENIEPNLMDINITDIERLDELLNIIELDNMPSNT